MTPRRHASSVPHRRAYAASLGALEHDELLHATRRRARTALDSGVEEFLSRQATRWPVTVTGRSSCRRARPRPIPYRARRAAPAGMAPGLRAQKHGGDESARAAAAVPMIIGSRCQDHAAHSHTPAEADRTGAASVPQKSLAPLHALVPAGARRIAVLGAFALACAQGRLGRCTACAAAPIRCGCCSACSRSRPPSAALYGCFDLLPGGSTRGTSSPLPGAPGHRGQRAMPST